MQQLLSTPPPPLTPLPHLLAASLRQPKPLRQSPSLCRLATPRQLLLPSLWEFLLPGPESLLSCLTLMPPQPQQWPQLATLVTQVLMLGCRLQLWTSLHCSLLVFSLLCNQCWSSFDTVFDCRLICFHANIRLMH